MIYQCFDMDLGSRKQTNAICSDNALQGAAQPRLLLLLCLGHARLGAHQGAGVLTHDMIRCYDHYDQDHWSNSDLISVTESITLPETNISQWLHYLIISWSWILLLIIGMRIVISKILYGLIPEAVYLVIRQEADVGK